MGKRLGNDFMQTTNRHIMGDGLERTLTAEELKKVEERMQEEQFNYVNHLMDKDKDCKSYRDKILVPAGNRVVVLPYDKNPYRVPVQESSSGLILGDFEALNMHKSHETGEMEESQRGIWCCKVIAVGKGCTSVQEGEDVYINFTFAAPLPFGGYGYYSISETNVICSVRLKE